MFRVFNILFFFFLVSKGTMLQAQGTSLADSLFRKLKNEKKDSLRVFYYDDLAWELLNTDPDSAIATSEKGLALSIVVHSPRGQSVSLASLGTFYFLKGEYAPALDYYLRALKINESVNNQSGIAHNLGNIGNLFYNQHEFEKALSYYERALKIEQQLLSGADSEKKKSHRLNRIAMWQGNIGNVYNGQSLREIDLRKKQELFEKALRYYELALKTDQSLNDESGISNWLSNIGTVYEQEAMMEKGPRRNELFAKALDYYNRSLRLEKKLQNNYGMAQRLLNIGILYSHKGEYAAAEKELLKALSIFKTLNTRDDERLVLESLSIAYEKMGKHKEALNALKNAVDLKDSLFTEEKNNEMARKELSFEFEKKEAIAKAEYQKELESQSAIAEEKSRKQKVIIYSIIAGLLLLSAFAAFILRSLRTTQKQKRIIELQKKEVELAKYQVEEQKKIVEEKNHDITDSINYAQRIQHALLAPENLLREYLRDHFIFFKPKDIVSGDFYWARVMEKGIFALVTADSTGHGVPGAIMSMLNMSSLKEASSNASHRPDLILYETRKLIIENLKNDGSKEGGKDGMDCAMIMFDLPNLMLHAACANNPVWIVRGGELIEIKPDKMPVGKHERDTEPFTLHSVPLRKNDMVYALTDGFADQFGGPKGKKFMYKALKELLKNISVKDLKQQHEELNRVFEDWKGSAEQVDDVTLIGVRI